MEDLHGEAAAGHAQHGRAEEVAAQLGRVERRRGDDDAPWPQVCYFTRALALALTTRAVAIRAVARAVRGDRGRGRGGGRAPFAFAAPALGGAPRSEQPLHCGEEHVGVERAFVRLVENERVDPRQLRHTHAVALSWAGLGSVDGGGRFGSVDGSVRPAWRA